jgi:hypothetical protein
MATWNVSTHYKKSVNEILYFSQKNGDGRIVITDCYRYGEWTVETSDDNPPQFEFTYLPGGDGKRDSINMLDCEVNNIESVELVEMFDGGCWYNVEVEELDDDAEEEIREFLEENSSFELEEREDDPWIHTETEWWIWGPIAIKNEAGETVRIVQADIEGRMVEFMGD